MRTYLVALVWALSIPSLVLAQDCASAPSSSLRIICEQITNWKSNTAGIEGKPKVAAIATFANGLSAIPQQPQSKDQCMTLSCFCGFLGGSGNPCSVNGRVVQRAYRKEYRALSDNERTRYHNAMWTIKNNGEYDRISRVHSEFRTSPGAHSGPAFLPWHREFLKRLEFALRTVDLDVAIPYWDSSLDSGLPNPRQSVMWSNELMGSTNNNNQVVTGAFANWRILDNSRIVTRSQGQGSLFTDSEINTLMGTSDINQVLAATAPANGCQVRAGWSALEYTHGNPHNFVGGDMLVTTRSTNDPIFYQHHSFIDYLWEQWRLRWQSRDARQTQYPQTDSRCFSTVHNGNSEMQPFGPLTNSDGLTNMYTDELFSYAPRPTCAANNINGCNSKYLFCDLSHGNPRCSAKIMLGGNCRGYNRNEDNCYNSVCVNGVCQAQSQTTTTTTTTTTTPRPTPSTTTTTRATTTSGTPSNTCLNSHYCCVVWRDSGYCARPEYAVYMREYCQPSCNICTGPSNWNGPACVDLHPSCPSWARGGECQRNPTYMQENCKVSCNSCYLLTTNVRSATCGFQTLGDYIPGIPFLNNITPIVQKFLDFIRGPRRGPPASPPTYTQAPPVYTTRPPVYQTTRPNYYYTTTQRPVYYITTRSPYYAQTTRAPVYTTVRGYYTTRRYGYRVGAPLQFRGYGRLPIGISMNKYGDTHPQVKFARKPLYMLPRDALYRPQQFAHNDRQNLNVINAVM